VVHRDWLAALGAVCAREVPAGGEGAPLEVVRETVRGADVTSAPRAAEHLEVLLGVLGYEVAWESLFEATVRPVAPAT
jgi:hypothetical protein